MVQLDISHLQLEMVSLSSPQVEHTSWRSVNEKIL